MKSEFRQFLEMKFLQWQQESGGRRTVQEFAAYIGVTQQAVSSWWNEERVPTGESVRKLADKFGLEVYDALDLERPDHDFYIVEKLWTHLSPEKRRKIREQAEKDAETNRDTTPATERRRARPA